MTWNSPAKRAQRSSARWLVWSCLAALLTGSVATAQEPLAPDDLRAVQAAEQARIAAIEQVYGAVVAIYDEGRQGGGSGVIISPEGLALTNHHVIMGAGVSGLGGLADGKLYRWKLLGTDPGGDLAVILLEGRNDFPYAPIGDSNAVKVGDFAMAMGNPFLLAEDHRPTVTLGIVSGIHRYQYGAGKNELVYGNCLQVDSSINPGNSGGPLFDMLGNVIGINGRGSFADRGRVNVGLGYAISSNQVKNFFPDLLATKLTEHGTLDAQFGMRGGRVVCETINLDSPIAQQGLELGDRLLEFQGLPIRSANEFTNLISTMPEDWPVQLKIEKESGEQRELWTRLLGLPYKPPAAPPEDQEIPEEQREQVERQQQLMDLLRKQPGVATAPEQNTELARRLWDQMLSQQANSWNSDQPDQVLEYTIATDEGTSVQVSLQLTADRLFTVARRSPDRQLTFELTPDGYQMTEGQGQAVQLSKAGARKYAEVLMAEAMVRLRHGLQETDKLTVDGGDFASGSICYRLKVEESDGDWWYLWLRTFNDEQGPRLAPVKISTDMDCRPFGLLIETGEASGKKNSAARWQVISDLAERRLETWTPIADTDHSSGRP